MENKTDNLGKALVQSVAKENILDTVQDIGEIVLDSALNNELLEQVPVLGWFKRAANIYHSVQERIFLKKIVLFLQGATGISEQDRKDFREHLEADPAYQREVGEKLILLLERHDDFQKSAFLGILFKAYIEGVLSQNEFDRLAHVVDQTYLGDLLLLLKDPGEANRGMTLENLELFAQINALPERFYSLGLSQMIAYNSARTGIHLAGPDPQRTYFWNDLAEKLQSILNETGK